MSVNELSESAQNYLKVIWSLQEWSDQPVTATVLAEKSGVKTSTVSGAISRLTDQGLVAHVRYGGIELTPQGREYALTMVRRHRLIETFLVHALGYGWDEVHDEAESLEHAVSDFMVERMDAVLGHPTSDPHGDPIPQTDGTLVKPDATRLSTLEPGSRGVVARIADDDPNLLRHLAERGVVVGVEVSLGDAEPYSEAVPVTTGEGQSVTLGRTAASSIWVTTP